ncbi:MAG: peptidoglycan recognition family protein [Planctomycetota bacterium]
MPDRRTLTVLACLVFGMTSVSALLLALEPGPMAPLSGVSLRSIDEGGSAAADRLFETPESLDWRAIVIHDSGARVGSSQSINRVHDDLGRGGLGYHFVVNNGSDEIDGLIEVGFRWQKQMIGAYLDGEGASWYHKHAIGICLIGDSDRSTPTAAQQRELVWLVRQLQRRYGIPADRVLVQVGSEGASTLFPETGLRAQLIQR